MATTMTLIAKQTVGADGVSSVTFSSIPTTYTDLKLVCSSRSTSGDVGVWVRFNNDSTQNYAWKMIWASGNTTYGSYSQTVGTNYDRSFFAYSSAGTYTANYFGSTDLYITNYRSSTNKSANIDSAGERDNATAYQSLTGGQYTTTSPITSITILPENGTANFPEFSTFYLYGISNNTTTQNTTVPYAYGGDVITTDGTYWYHAFKYSGSFVPQKNLTADILVVAGGGSGGTYYRGGGGGAGGLKGFTAQSLTNATSYTCTIGAGAAGAAYGANGSNSQFGSLTAAVGGGAGGDYNINGGNGGNGGSGGGGGQQSSIYGAGGTGTSGQGNNGGAAGYQNGGGGGGASVAGGDGGNAYAGAGGNGSSAYSSWLSATTTGQNVSGTYYIAGGGSGAYYSPGGNVAGAAGYGGGGTGGSAAGTAGTANTGGGGGGSNYPSTGGNGGSGIIIVRYAV